MSEGLSADARMLLARFAETTVHEDPPSERERRWELTVERARKPRRAKVAVIAGVLAAAAAVTFVLVPRAPVVRASNGARWERHEDVITVSLGQLRLQMPHKHLRVVTPQLQVELENARALVDVASGQTVLAVDEGEAVYRTPRGEWRLKAGERIVINDVVESMAVAASAPIRTCAGDDATCLAKVAGGSGLAAEMALYREGMLARERGAVGDAITAMREYGRRFPTGTFAPEASIALMLSLEASGETRAALEEAERFAQRFPTDPRVPEVRTWGARHEEVQP